MEDLSARRRAARYTLRYPENLPIAAARGEILEALANHRVIIVCGETGSGKTTQLPKLCLEAGRGIAGMIGHTQPRRIAAQAVATRLAEELEVKLGEEVALEYRFTDRTNPAALVKVMTDGILLNEIRRDRLLRKYDTLIIDEAHERTLNIDFLLGYLKRIERDRPDLKIVITSATIDPERFSRHFGGAPILYVEGRSYPVEVRYRPLAENQDLHEAVVDAAHELAAEHSSGLRDMLVFLPGERWIRDAAHELQRRGPKGYEVLPLYARLTNARQRQILTPRRAPRIVLATNIAETSLTVPRIRYVIDSGLARVSRYATRHRVQSLGVEPISKANAAQRAGRCGRLAPGVCVRLFSEEDFIERPDFPEPEIRRTGLAGVILKLESLRLGPIDDFPFIDSPPAKAVNDAYQLLHLLGAVDERRQLTRDGKLLARLPLDPRVAKLLLAGHRAGALREALVIAAALSVVDPREHAPEALEASRKAHEKFADSRSDFVTYLNLWEAYREVRRAGQRALRAWCKENYLSITRLKEWHDVHGQLHELAQGLGWRTRAAAADYRAVHQAVLAAFVDFIAEHDEGNTYRGMREARAQLFPGTPLARKRPKWLVAAERVATERQYLRTVAQVNPRWALRVAPHLVKLEYHDPQWDAERGQVTAREVIRLFGLRIGSERRVDYGRVAPADARRIFVSDALAADQLAPAEASRRSEPAFLRHNRAVRAAVLEWEARLRKRDLYVGEQGLVRFYEERLPMEVHDRTTLLGWIAISENDARLRISESDVSTRPLDTLPQERYPRSMRVAEHELPLRYAYEPGADHDGITLELPRALLGAIRVEQLEWLVPGWLPEKVTALLRALPKELRRDLVPLPDTVASLLPELERRAGTMPFAAALHEALTARGVRLEASLLDERHLPEHLRMRVEVIDADGTVRAASRDLRFLQRELGGGVVEQRAKGRAAPAAWTRTGLTQWDFGDLPERVVVPHTPQDLALYPALQDHGGRVDLGLLPPGRLAEESHRAGTRRLLLSALPQQTALIRRQTLAARALTLSFHGLGTSDALVDDLLTAAADEAFALDDPVRTRAAFAAVLEQGRSELVPAADRLRALLLKVLGTYRELRRALDGPANVARRNARGDILEQLGRLVRAGFLTATPVPWRRHLPRYLAAAQLRWERLAARSARDAELQAQARAAEERLEAWARTQPKDWPWSPEIVHYRWMLEEFRVSLFAQSLGTATPVSAKRLDEAWRRALARG